MAKNKKPYARPQLRVLGTVADIDTSQEADAIKKVAQEMAEVRRKTGGDAPDKPEADAPGTDEPGHT